MNEIKNTLTPTTLISSLKIQNILDKSMASKIDKSRFVTNYLATATSDELRQCNPETIFFGCLKAHTYGFTTGDGNFSLIRYGNVCQFQINAQGYRTLAMNTRLYADIDAVEVRKNDFKGRNKLTGQPVIEFEESYNEDDATNPVIGYLAYAIPKDDRDNPITFFMTKEQCDKHGKTYSKVYNKLWGDKDNFPKMCKKTVIKFLCDKKLSKSNVLLQEAVKFDQAVIKDEDIVEYVDNPKSNGNVKVQVEELLLEEGE